MRCGVGALLLLLGLGWGVAGAQGQGIKVYGDIDFERSRRVIYISDADGSGARELTEGHSPSLSPDQKQVAFGGADRFTAGLWVMDLESGEKRWLLDSIKFAEMLGESGPSSVRQIRWSPDKKLIFFDWVSGFMIDLYVINVDGTNPRLVVKGGSLAASSWPSFLSPDGRKLLYNTCFDECFTLFVLDLDTGERVQLSDRSEVGSWSPDGRRVAFGDAFGRPGLFVADVVTGEQVDVLSGAGRVDAAVRISWSADGQRLAYTRLDESAGAEEVYEVGLDGRGLKGRAVHFPAYAVAATTVVDPASWGTVKQQTTR